MYQGGRFNEDSISILAQFGITKLYGLVNTKGLRAISGGFRATKETFHEGEFRSHPPPPFHDNRDIVSLCEGILEDDNYRGRHVGKKPFPACDLGMALECFQGVAEGLGTSLKPFEGFVCGARVKSLQQGSTRDPDQVFFRHKYLAPAAVELHDKMSVNKKPQDGSRYMSKPKELSPRSKTGGNHEENGPTVNNQLRRFRKKERKRKTRVVKILACKIQF
ncbi:hypothetical protein K438DRAFT_1755184 [Mycena galopus ATCC 62051]|nr:hypothetical protein K438DRAFT_1755184 [Mycena galopus ATCC 62051]